MSYSNSSKRRSPDTETFHENLLSHSKLTKLTVSMAPPTLPLTKRICVPPSTVPTLSASTASIISELKSSTPLIPFSSEISSITPYQKFRHLLSSTKSLPLPDHHLKLVRLFRAIDSSIYFAHLNRSSTFFSKIQMSVEQSFNLSCNISSLMQILNIHPQAYRVGWALADKDFEIVVDFCEAVERDDLTFRKAQFDEMVLERVRMFHAEFLRSTGLMWENDDCWHAQFDLQSVPEPEEAVLAEKPLEKVTDVQRFVSEQMTNTKKVQSYDTSQPDVVEDAQIKGLSPMIAAKVMAKERFLQSQRAHLVEDASVKEHTRGERLMKMIEIIKVLFSTHKTPSMFLYILLEKLGHLTNNKNCRIVEEDLMEVLQIFPRFIVLIQTNSGPVVRVYRENDIKLSDLNLEIKKKYNLQ